MYYRLLPTIDNIYIIIILYIINLLYYKMCIYILIYFTILEDKFNSNGKYYCAFLNMTSKVMEISEIKSVISKQSIG